MAHNIIVVGGSAGSLEALLELTGQLKRDLDAALFVVIHFPPFGVSHLPHILNRSGTLPAHIPADGEYIENGRLYVSELDHHLVIQGNRIRLTRDARENHSRPAIDPLFRSAAASYGPNVTGVILSGLLNDGTSGLIEIKRRGGIAIVQNPASALFTDMPRSAIDHVPGVDYVLDPDEIAAQLVRITQHRAKISETARATMPGGKDELGEESKSSVLSVQQDVTAHDMGERDGEPSIYSCPDCGGVLWPVAEENFLRFRCHVGHAFSAESLLQQQSEVLEGSMWYALRTVLDKARLARQLAGSARERGHATSVNHFEEQARVAEHHGEVIRAILSSSVAGKDVPPKEKPSPGKTTVGDAKSRNDPGNGH